MTASELAEYLDDFLAAGSVTDYPGAWNGLQVDRSGSVRRVAFAVDAAEATIRKAIQWGADLMVVHHGLFWDGIPTLTGRRYRRIRALMEANVGLYSSHLPLDAHVDVGNNIVLARALGLEVEGSFGDYKGTAIGVHGRLAVRREALAARLDELLGGRVHMIPGGPERIQRVGIVTGGGGSFVEAARLAGLDALVTGEGAHHNYFDAIEGGVTLYLGGHYATEVWGLKALADHLVERFRLDSTFIDHPTGL